MKQQSKKYLILILLIAVLVVPTFASAAWWNPFSWGFWSRIFHFQQTQKEVVCTMDAKLCPDGSYVGRTGPNCEFKPCPTDQTAGWKTYTNSQYGYEIKYPQTAQLKIDNRYPNEGCVHIDYKDGDITFGRDLENTPNAICAGFTGRGGDNVPLYNQKLSIGGKDYYFGGGTNLTKTYLILDGKLSDKLNFWYSTGFNGNNKASDTEDTLKQMLSTFKFTTAVNNNPSATIDSPSLVVSSSQSTITGAATNVTSLSVNIIATTPAKPTDYTTLFGSGNVPVLNGRWSLAIPAGTFTGFSGPYKVEVGTINSSGTINVLSTETLTVTQ